MDDTEDRHLHFNDKGEPIYLSGHRADNRHSKSRYQIMQERYCQILEWKYEHSKN